MRIDTSKFVVGKTYEFTSPSHPDWIGFRVRAEPQDMMTIVRAGQKTSLSDYKVEGAIIGRGGFYAGDFWTPYGPQNSFGKWFKEHGL